jgi:hypothetical protein
MAQKTPDQPKPESVEIVVREVETGPPLASEEVVLAAPASYTGSAQRISKLARKGPQEGWQYVAVQLGTLALIGLAWLGVTAWYLTWGLFLIPYRLIRRGQRKRKLDELRHREQLAAFETR